MTCAICGEQLRQPEKGRRRRYCSRSCQARAYRSRRDAVVSPRRTARPIRLTTVGIVRAAVELADNDGIGGLSMRRLAGALGIATASLYRHIPDREALLAAMAELVLAEIPPSPAHSTDWRAQLTYEAWEEWRLYRRHPWMLTILARTRPPLGPALFDILERTLSALDRPGLPAEQMLAIYLSVSGLVQGIALLWTSERAERVVGVEALTGSDAQLRDLQELLNPATRPVLHRLFANAPTGLDLDFDALLETGLELLLDGVAMRHLSPTQ
ncbi:TetR/AcrR family transcriptional regulator [Nocardia sp. GCM10030253]|uniref:TetR/AcrR family transcriptional regulator n=1 Tax=Nocardia sp. GCM10030253 TaxID=3273404 RepID=UPI0036339439